MPGNVMSPSSTRRSIYSYAITRRCRIQYVFEGVLALNSMLEDDFSARLDDAIRQFLLKIHAHNAARPIRLPYDSGQFPDPGYGAVLLRESLLVVPDTNILLQDLRQSCRSRRRQTLVNAANVGAIRLFCAEHVVDEMYKHIELDALPASTTREELLERWECEYLPFFASCRTLP